MDLRAEAVRLFQAAVAAADPADALRRAFLAHPVAAPLQGGAYIVIAVGKAAVPMAEAALDLLTGAPVRALVVTNYENARPVAGAVVMAAGHPVPDENGAAAGAAVADLLQAAGKADRVIALISGGGSALLPAPAPGLTLADKVAVNRLLLANGFEITEINLIRQQLSRLKGGGMLRLAAPAAVTAYILSDVIGDDLRAIASGPTVAPLGTKADAVRLLRARGLWSDLPLSVRAHLDLPDDQPVMVTKATNHLIGSNRASLAAAVASYGPGATIVSDQLVGDVEAAAAKVVAAALAPGAANCLIFGGETTVTLRGTGKGGRNQELALRVAMTMPDQRRPWVFLSGGTDGRDGPTDAAGGLVDAGTVGRIRAAGGDPVALLAANDSNRALDLAGDLLVTGATGTNVADVQILVLGPSWPNGTACRISAHGVRSSGMESEARMTVRTEFPHAISIQEDIGIMMPDGVRLSARVWMPVDAATRPVPAVLEYIPYRKRDGTLPRDEMMHAYVAGHGYGCIRVDMRGNGDSQGLMEDEYSEQELRDAEAVIDWLSHQPWCSGAVGMMGKSWGGFNCLQTAFRQPPALKAVVSVCSTTDRFADDIHFKGGCLLGENFGWGAVMLAFSSRPADPLLRNDWKDDWLQRLEAQPWLAPRWASHQAKDAYWKHGSVGEDWGRNVVPAMIWGGWADNYMNTVAALVEHSPAPTKGVVGPWVHQYPHTAVPGPRVGFLQMAIRWWDRWLKGVDNGAEADPAYRAYILHSEPPNASPKHRAGHWVEEGAWPSPRVTPMVLHLANAGAGVSHPRTPVEYLSQEEAGPVKCRICTPQHLGLEAGEFFPMGLNAEMPGDQAGDDAMSLCFDGDVLGEDLQLLGAADLRLLLASDRPLGFVVARLCDVAPDGSSVRIAHGMLNLCHRQSPETPAPMVPGQEVEVAFALDQMGYRLAAGHRLRLALSNSYWPFVWPSPEVVTLTVTGGSLTLPVHRGADAAEWVPPPAEHAKPWAHRVVRPGQARRRVERDLITGIRTLIVEDDQGDTENLDHGLVSGESLTERWEIHPDDPLSARAVHHWEQRLSRGPWAVRTRAEAEMTATATHLRMIATLEAWEGDRKVFERRWEDEVEREFV